MLVHVSGNSGTGRRGGRQGRGARNWKYSVYSVSCKIAGLTDTRGPCSLMEICKCFLKRRNLFALLLITLKIIKNQSTELYAGGLPVDIFCLYHTDEDTWTPGKGAGLRSEGLHSSPSSAPHDLWDLEGIPWPRFPCRR